ncbi:hypothetical protein [Paenibacillus illinoisensis]|uniref:hypothetical protein n=1 Tax=Paenibacillus illinoisensis TaxID=59845 RepID=UPI0015E8CC85|nr:hypothetical protein [Paenibacillus illinoisensis]
MEAAAFKLRLLRKPLDRLQCPLLAYPLVCRNGIDIDRAAALLVPILKPPVTGDSRDIFQRVTLLKRQIKKEREIHLSFYIF